MDDDEPTAKIHALYPYLSAPGAAQLLRTTRRAVYTLIERGFLDGAVLRIRRRILLKRKELVALLDRSLR